MEKNKFVNVSFCNRCNSSWIGIGICPGCDDPYAVATHYVEVWNLTPHDINIIGINGELHVTIPQSGIIARRRVERKHLGDVGGIQITNSIFHETEGLPNSVAGRWYIVSSILADGDDVRGRTDLYTPDDIIRDETGVIIGCRCLRKVF